MRPVVLAFYGNLPSVGGVGMFCVNPIYVTSATLTHSCVKRWSVKEIPFIINGLKGQENVCVESGAVVYV